MDHISVCICTFQRPRLLLRLLEALERQETSNLFTYSAVIVDNDAKQSARSAVENFARESSLPVRYYSEPVQNISLARNKAVSAAEGKYLAFVDDDELPPKRWLINLYRTCLQFKADGVLAPVEPYFEEKPPDWVVKGRLCERPRFKTGTRIADPGYTRTGNVLVLKDACREKEGPFDPGRGRSGGEDYEFFDWMLKRGRSIFWCDEAPVYESVPQERLKRMYYLKRGLLRGGLTSRDVPVISYSTMKSILAVALYGAALPVLALLGHHFFMRYLMKECDHLGKLLGFCGIMLMRERSF